jgi:RNA polymerase sigma-70 factor (ECF subfamily)
VEDVFQGSFLLLADRAAAVSWEASVGGWLHGVARRLALKTRSRSARRRSRESLTGAIEAQPDALDELERRELRRVLDDALRLLPEKYRAPVELCYLEGKTNAEAARQLGWPAGSMSRRLHRARVMLRQRLAHSGLMLVGLIATAIFVLRMPYDARQDPSARALVSQAMQTLHRPADKHRAIAADRELAVELGRKAQNVAREIAGHDPGRDRERWEFHVARMQRAAADLATAAGRSDHLAVLAAARRLDATCVNCHEVFRVQTEPWTDSDSGFSSRSTQF